MIHNKKDIQAINDEEIDLLALLLQLIYILKRNVLFIIGIVIISVLISVVIYLKASPYYKTRMIANSGILPNTEIINIVESWQSLINKGDYVTLANILKLDAGTTSKIVKLEAEDTGTGKPEQTTGTKNENSFMISVEVTDVAILDSLQSAIIYTLENNEYIKKRAVINRENFELLKKKIENEISAIDSVKIAVKDLLNGGNSTSTTFLSNPAEVNLQIVDLYERILNLEASLKLSEDIQVIESFIKATKRDGPFIKRYISIGIAVGVFAAFLLIIFKLLNKRIKQITSSPDLTN